MINRKTAEALLHEHVQSESLRRHCYAVAAAMEAYGIYFKEDPEVYWTAGLLHDFDYERFPTLEKHPFEGVKILKEQRYSANIIEAILGHGDHTNVPRISKMAKALFAVDELCGLLVALAKVRADNFDSMSAESVEKALKKKRFAAAINRDDIEKGIQELGVEKKEHFERVITALKEKKREL